MPSPSGASAVWQEARNADGRIYYYNVQTKATQWAKPVELMTPVEVCFHLQSSTSLNSTDIAFWFLQRALSNQPWKEYTAEGGRKYWYNTETKQSTWEIPEVYKNALAQAPAAPTPAAPAPPAAYVELCAFL